MMKYKNYIGSIEVSLEDNVLHGKLLHIKDLVTYEANTPAELEVAFHEAVDDYLTECEADGVQPDVPFKGVFNVRITPVLHRNLAMSAQAKGCNLNEYVKSVLEAHEGMSIAASTMTHYVNFGGRHKSVAEREFRHIHDKENSVAFLLPVSTAKAEKCH